MANFKLKKEYVSGNIWKIWTDDEYLRRWAKNFNMHVSKNDNRVNKLASKLKVRS